MIAAKLYNYRMWRVLMLMQSQNCLQMTNFMLALEFPNLRLD